MTEDKYRFLYDVFVSGADLINADERRHHVVLYDPDVYVELAKENMRLRDELQRIRKLETRFVDELRISMNLLDKLRWCEKTLLRFDVRLPFRCDGSDS